MDHNSIAYQLHHTPVTGHVVLTTRREGKVKERLGGELREGKRGGERMQRIEGTEEWIISRLLKERESYKIKNVKEYKEYTHIEEDK